MGQNKLSKWWAALAFMTLIIFVMHTAAFAHVKWFSDFSFSDQPLSLSEAVNTTFMLLAVLSMAVIGAMVYLDRRLMQTLWYKQTNSWLKSQSKHSLMVMRVSAGAVLLLSWQADAMMVPELSISSSWVGWYQFVLAFMLLFSRTVPVAGLGLIGLYGFGIYEFGMFHMLDYPMYAGAGYYLLVGNSSNKKIRGTGLPALYLTVGFSLCWVALEKMVYPQWGMYVLQQYPQLTMGFDPSFFLIGAAFVEFSLGYLLIICLLQRPLALVITLVFFTTTLFFGKIEVIGHTLIHGALIVFLFEGPGTIYNAPVTFHKNLKLRTAFASVNFGLLLAILLTAYTFSAWQQYEERDTVAATHAGVTEISDTAAVPMLDLELLPDELTGWNLHVEAQNFRFAPRQFGQPYQPGEGHAHLYINGKKRARIYSPWFHLESLPVGRHILRVTLNANNHDMLTHQGNVIADTVQVTVE